MSAIRCWLINEVTYFPLTDQERLRQIAVIERKRTEVEEFHSHELTENQIVNEIALCMEDFEHFCDYYLYTFDPRPGKISEQVNRFILYEYQRVAAIEIIAAIEDGEDLLIEKSRDMGASWLILAIFLWFWLRAEYFHAHLGSRAESLVDDFTVDSLFGRFDFMLDHFPDWMKMQMPYNPKQGRKLLHLESLEKSLISGESTNPNFGRGPRKRAVLLDEFASVECDRELWSGVSETSPCKILASTPKGNTNLFAELRFGGTMKILTFHWTQHPFKTVEWYDKKIAKMRVEDIASELDIDYQASGGRIALPELKLSENRIIIPRFEPDPADFDFDMGLDYGTTRSTSIHCYAKTRFMKKSEKFPRIYSIWEYYEPSNVHKASEAIKGCKYFSLVQNIYADPSMWSNNQTVDDGKSVTSVAVLFYDYENIILSSGKRGDGFPLAQLQLMWGDPDNPYFFIFEECENQIREWKELQYVKQSTAMSQKHNPPQKLRDKNNHSWDDFKYYYNQTFSGVVVEESDAKRGYEALQEGFSKLREQKLAALTRKPPRRRIFFR